MQLRNVQQIIVEKEQEKQKKERQKNLEMENFSNGNCDETLKSNIVQKTTEKKLKSTHKKVNVKF